MKGAGTLLRRGARIVGAKAGTAWTSPACASSSRRASGAPRCDAFFRTTPSHVYLEEAYRGCAILVDTPLGAYLTKFAVSPEAQGEGIARDLWEAFAADAPVVFWRARRTNPISEWYMKLCDGLVRVPGWTIYWKGLAAERDPRGDRLGREAAGGHPPRRGLTAVWFIRIKGRSPRVG